MAWDTGWRSTVAERPRLSSVRVRTTIGATVVVGVALVVGSLLLVGVLRGDLRATVDRAASLRARDVAALLSSGTAPTDLAVDGDESSLVQVLDARGHVVASSRNIAGEPAIADVAGGEVRTVSHLPISDGHAFRVAVVRVATPAGQFRVLAAQSLEPADEGVASLAALLAGGLPALVLLVTLTTWVVTGRALRPVEAIRAEVSAITSAELGRRVPEPAGDDEIARLARTMNEMLERLDAASARQQRFVSDASHELRSPIATIRHELEVLLANPQGVEIREFAARLLSEDLRMQSLVDDLLLLARADEGTLAPKRRPVDLDDLVMTEIARLRQRGKVRVDASGVLAGQVIGDPGQLARVLRNLLDNAERHAQRTVTVTLREHNGLVSLTVDDDGPGIAPAERATIFERFTRLDAARARASGGHGLGLAIVRQTIEAHGGTVEAAESPDGGARFTLALPVAPGLSSAID